MLINFVDQTSTANHYTKPPHVVVILIMNMNFRTGKCYDTVLDVLCHCEVLLWHHLNINDSVLYYTRVSLQIDAYACSNTAKLKMLLKMFCNLSRSNTLWLIWKHWLWCCWQRNSLLHHKIVKLHRKHDCHVRLIVSVKVLHYCRWLT